MATIGTFKRLCEVQGVTLDPVFLQEATTEPYVRSFAHGPENHMLRAVTHAAWLLRGNTSAPLVQGNRQLDLSVFGDDVPMTALARIINCTLKPASSNADTYELPGPTHDSIHVCTDSEELWIRSLENPRKEAGKRPMAQFFTEGGTPDGRLVAARQMIAIHSALTFISVNIGGVVYPPGALLKLNKYDDQLGKHPGQVLPHGNGYAVYDAAEITGAAAMRLSGFALPLEQRVEYGLAESMPNRTLYGLQQFAKAAMATTQ